MTTFDELLKDRPRRSRYGRCGRCGTEYGQGKSRVGIQSRLFQTVNRKQTPIASVGATYCEDCAVVIYERIEALHREALDESPS